MPESPSPAVHLSPGDPLPRIALPAADGQVVDLTDQRWAGRTTLLWLNDGATDAWMRALEARLAAFDALEALVCLVSPQPATGCGDRLVCLSDAAGGLARLAGVAPPALLVADPRGRLAAVLPGLDLDAAEALARRLHAASQPATIAAQAPVLLVDQVLEPAFCDRLIAHWQGNAKLADGVAVGAQAANRADREVKRRRDVVLDHMALYAPFRQRVGQRVLPEIQKAFQVRITQMEAPRIGCYAAADGGWFRRHRDNRTRFTAHRLFAMSLNLNTGAYDGGALRFPEYGRQLYSPPAGGAVVFSCNLLHEALPVTRGERFGVFTFFHDEAGEARVRALLEAERAAGRTGHTMRGTE